MPDLAVFSWETFLIAMVATGVAWVGGFLCGYRQGQEDKNEEWLNDAGTGGGAT